MNKGTTDKSAVHFGYLGKAYGIFGVLVVTLAVVLAALFSLMPDYPTYVLLIIPALVAVAVLMLKTGFGILNKKPGARFWAIIFGLFFVIIGLVSFSESKLPSAVVELLFGAYSIWVMLRPGSPEAWNIFISGGEQEEG